MDQKIDMKNIDINKFRFFHFAEAVSGAYDCVEQNVVMAENGDDMRLVIPEITKLNSLSTIIQLIILIILNGFQTMYKWKRSNKIKSSSRRICMQKSKI
jgi:hypothetical protein